MLLLRFQETYSHKTRFFVLVARSNRTSTFLENWRTARRVPLLPARLHLNAHFGERFAVRFAVRFKVRFAVSLAGLDKALEKIEEAIKSPTN
jgi:hypothetical protein